MKQPQNIPERGDRCRLRGKPAVTGMLKTYNPENEWSVVNWDDGVIGPKLCHRFELEKISAPPS